MNSDIIKGNWEQVKGLVRSKWGKLTNDDLDVIAGKREMLIGKLREVYGMQRDQAEREIETLSSSKKH